jgi:pyruvate/2-oxoglutarate dehydrogenase complex dihydrolipoamide acyltransferase (E2) component
MAQSNDPALGINSWLEDELYYQYQFDKKSVDERWTQLFQHGANENSTTVAQRADTTQTGVAVAEEPLPPPVQPVAPPSAPQPAPAAPSSLNSPPQNGSPSSAVVTTPKLPAKQEAIPSGPGEQLIPLRGVAAKIAENMAASLSIPVATSQRQIPVRVIEENRNLINKQRAMQGKGKLSFTHLIAWAIVRAVKSNP